MARGSAPGERRGGRQKGVPNKKSAALQAKVAETGMTPLDVMLDNMRFAYGEAGELLNNLLKVRVATGEDIDEFKSMVRFRQIAQECAKDAAPYLHPRLAAVEHTGKDGGAIVVKFDSVDANA